MKSADKRTGNGLKYGVVVLFLLFLISVVLRLSTFSSLSLWSHYDGERWWNDEVTGHVINVLSAYRQLPASSHFFMPIAAVSRLEAAEGHTDHRVADLFRDPDWGAFAVDRSGNIQYISFPPGGFMLTHMILVIAGADPAPLSIIVLNLSLQFLTALLLMVLIIRVFRRRPSDTALYVIAAASASTYIFALEALHSHGVPFWPHQILQPLIVLSALTVASECRHNRAVLLALPYLMAMTEWTGFLVGIAMSAALLFMGRRRGSEDGGRYRMEWLFPLLGMFFAGLTIVGLNAWRVGFTEYVSLLSGRFGTRTSFGEKGLMKLRYGLMTSMGVYFAALAVLAGTVFVHSYMAVRNGRLRKIDWAIFKNWRVHAAVWSVLSLPLLENLLLADHAIIYSYDRLKWLLPLTFGLATVGVYLVRESRRYIYVFIVIMMISAVVSLIQYRDKFSLTSNYVNGVPLGETACLNSMRRISEYISETSEPDEAVFISSRVMPVLQLPYSGDRPIAVAHVGEAREWLRDYGWSLGRLYIVGGTDFDRPGDRQPLGGVSAVLTLYGSDETVDIRLLRASLPEGIEVSDNEFPVHNSVLEGLVLPGTVLSSADGKDFTVISWSGNRLVLDDDAAATDELMFSGTLDEDMDSVTLDVFDQDTPIVCRHNVKL